MSGKKQSPVPALLFMLLLGCGSAAVIGGKIASGSLQNGVYNGTYASFPNGADVRVTVRDGRITAIRILRHNASWIGARAEEVVQSIIREQSTKVDAVSGATNSSRVIMNAVQDALEKAKKR